MSTGRLARWSLLLQGYSFTIHHRPGKLNTVADALNRRTYQPHEDETVPTKIIHDTVPVHILKPQIENESPIEHEYIQAKFEYDTQEAPKNPLLIGLLEGTPKQDIELPPVMAATTDLASAQRESSDFGSII